MKKTFILILAGFFMIAGALGAQTPQFPDVTALTPENLFAQTMEPAYGLLVLLSGYISYFIPGIKKWAPFYRVAAFGLVGALGWALFGGASIWKLALTYFVSSGLYAVILSNILKSPRIAATTATALLLCFGMPASATAQTLTITPVSVEVISAGAKTRSFYAVDDVFILTTKKGGVTVKSATDGTILFAGDTAEVTIAGATSDVDIWDDKFTFLTGIYHKIPLTGVLGVTPSFTLAPKRGLNYIYKNANETVAIINSRTKFQIWSGGIENLVDGADVSNTLYWIRHNIFQDIGRYVQEGGGSPTVSFIDSSVVANATVEGVGCSGLIEFTTATGGIDSTGNIIQIQLPVYYTRMFVKFSPATDETAKKISSFYAVGNSNVFSIYLSGLPLAEDTTYQLTYSVTGYNSQPGD